MKSKWIALTLFLPAILGTPSIAYADRSNAEKSFIFVVLLLASGGDVLGAAEHVPLSNSKGVNQPGGSPAVSDRKDRAPAQVDDDVGGYCGVTTNGSPFTGVAR
ncbi:hypothetical protein WDW37_17475 [Bdellovibrionota bacterium FG-1]